MINYLFLLASLILLLDRFLLLLALTFCFFSVLASVLLPASSANFRLKFMELGVFGYKGRKNLLEFTANVIKVLFYGKIRSQVRVKDVPSLTSLPHKK